jgi:hypothetical protein
VKLITCEVSCLVVVLPVAETQLGEDCAVDALMEKPAALHPVGKLDAKTLSKFSEYGNVAICANVDVV